MPRKLKLKPLPSSEESEEIVTPDWTPYVAKEKPRLLLERVCEVLGVHPDQISLWERLTDGHRIRLFGGPEYQISDERVPKE